MRRFMSIVEHASGLAVPDGKQFVTDGLIDRIITTGHFTTHGDDTLQEWFEECRSWDYTPELLRDIPYEEAVATPEFRQLFRYWMHDLRAPYVTRELRLLTPETLVVRAMYVSDEWIAALSEPLSAPLPLGVFWTTGEAMPHGASSDGHIGKREIYLVAKMSDVTVDWRETFESRFDFQNGDMEEEIQLLKGSPLPSVKFEAGERYDLGDDAPAISVHPSNKFIA